MIPSSPAGHPSTQAQPAATRFEIADRRSGNVALAQWWFWKVSGDDDFYLRQATTVLIDSARFRASRAIYNKALDLYELRAVCCADELAGIRDNNAYTNYSAVKPLRIGP